MDGRSVVDRHSLRKAICMALPDLHRGEDVVAHSNLSSVR